jgi:hypothetical protein
MEEACPFVLQAIAKLQAHPGREPLSCAFPDEGGFK